MFTDTYDRIAVYSTDTKQYGYFERFSRANHTRRCIDGKTTGSNKCVGYCKFNGHPGFLTALLREQHSCIEKGCDYYVPKAKSSQQKSYDRYRVYVSLRTEPQF